MGLIDTKDGEEQFSLMIHINNKLLVKHGMTDPFIHSTLWIAGWRDAWRCFLAGLGIGKGIVVNLTVNGSQAAEKAVMMLDPKAMDETNRQLDEERARRKRTQTDLVGFCRDLSNERPLPPAA